MSSRHRLTGAALAMLLALTATPAAAQSTEDLERRLTLVERKLSSDALTEIVNELGALRRDLNEMRGERDVFRRQFEQLEERQRQIYADVDSRLQALEQRSSGAPGGGGFDDPAGPDAEFQRTDDLDVGMRGGESGAGGIDIGIGEGDDDETEADQGLDASSIEGDVDRRASERPRRQERTTEEPSAGMAGDDDGASEAERYRAAFETLRAGNYEDAVDQFEGFLARYPEGELSANARYWLGESHYVVREFDAALNQFERVLSDFPDSGKAADALLKVGFVQYEQGRLDEARGTLRDVVERYSGTTAASLAEQRLNRMDG